jgi:hypothetical protein
MNETITIRDKVTCVGNLYPELKDQCLTVVGLGGAYGNTFIFENDTKRYKKEDFVLKEKGVEPIIERHDFSVNKTFAVLNSSDKKYNTQRQNEVKNSEQNFFTTIDHYKDKIEKYKDENKIPTYKKGYGKTYIHMK